jgi:hypothetical protein
MPEEWNVYRTRFLVNARQLTRPLEFTDPLGREHRGRPGDYLVQTSEGLFRIAAREIFEDVYVLMEHEQTASSHLSPPGTWNPNLKCLKPYVEKAEFTGNSHS